MEGLLLAELLRALTARLPLARGRWTFHDDRTLALQLGGGEALWIWSRPPDPRMAIEADTGTAGAARTPFQAMLSARAVGPLLSVRQQQLDRVAEFTFGEAEGFVPGPAVTLVAELTGRNANLVLLDTDRCILGVERRVMHDRNRYRELRPGIAYLPPPPYQKTDPLRATDLQLAELLRGRRLAELRSLVDGVGPKLARALAVRTGLSRDVVLAGAELEAVIAALREACRAPAALLASVGDGVDMAEERRRDLRAHALAALRARARGRLELASKRARDARLAILREEDVELLRAEADLLNTYASEVPDGAAAVTLKGFDGTPRTITLDPGLDARANARRRYAAARKRRSRADRARAQADALVAEEARAAGELEALDTLDDATLLARAAALEDREETRTRATLPGIRFHDERGFEVVVGRSAKENDLVTFRVARSLDVWLHVQGSPGSHVIIRAGGREVPFDTILFAASLAAGFSPARRSDNVAVDYTLRKYVWKVKGLPAGAVHFTQQKTVVVTPARTEEAAAVPSYDPGA